MIRLARSEAPSYRTQQIYAMVNLHAATDRTLWSYSWLGGGGRRL
jgi:hypothetical protein